MPIPFTDVKCTLEICARLTLVQAKCLLNLVRLKGIQKKRSRTFSEKCLLTYHRNVKLIFFLHSASITSHLVHLIEEDPEQFQCAKKTVCIWNRKYVNRHLLLLKQYQEIYDFNFHLAVIYLQLTQTVHQLTVKGYFRQVRIFKGN